MTIALLKEKKSNSLWALGKSGPAVSPLDFPIDRAPFTLFTMVFDMKSVHRKGQLPIIKCDNEP